MNQRTDIQDMNSIYKFFMAPMAEVTTPVFRDIVREFSSETVLCSEMLSAAAVSSGSEFNEPLLTRSAGDEPFVYQLLGGEPGIMADACSILAETGCWGIDINMGCSAPAILKKCQGARLLKDESLARDVVKRCRAEYSGRLSVKMRSGFTDSNPECMIRFAKMLQDEGVDYLTLHGRHAKLSFSRTADWKLVKTLKENLDIPVVGNGDISRPEDAAARFIETGCDGVMIGREAVRAPWMFRAAREYISDGSYNFDVDLFDIFARVMNNIELTLPADLHKSRAHRFCFYFTKNFIFSHELFKKIRNLDRIGLMIDIIRDYTDRNPHERIKTVRGGL